METRRGTIPSRPGVNDAAVRDLCRQIAQETDPENSRQLLVSLRSALKEKQEEARLRMSQIARHYRRHIREPEQDSTRTEHPRFRGLRGLLETGLGVSFGRDSNPPRRPEDLISQL
jgi:hypothetical protein